MLKALILKTIIKNDFCSKYKNAKSITERIKTNCKNRGIKGYKNMSKDKLLSICNAPESIKENETIKDIRKENSNIDDILKDIKPLFEPEPIK